MGDEKVVREFEGKKVEAREECLREYAALRKIDISRAKTTKAVVRSIQTVNDEKGEAECAACGFPVLLTDTFCPFCGADTTEDDDGGWDAYKAGKGKKAEEKPEEAEEEAEEEEAEAEEEADGEEGAQEKKGKKEKKEPEDDGDPRSLEERVSTILDIEKNIRKTGGEGAFDMGLELARIKSGKKYADKFDSFKTFVEADQKKGGVGMSFAGALSYIRISTNLTREQAGALGVAKSVVIATAPDEVRTKLLAPTKDGVIKAVTLEKSDIAETVKSERAKGKPEGTPARGRPRKSKFEDIAGTFTAKAVKIAEGTSKVIDLDGLYGLKITFKGGKAIIKFVPTTPSDEE